MGYRIRIAEAEFEMAAADRREAFDAIKQLMTSPEAERSGRASKPTNIPVDRIDSLDPDKAVTGANDTYTVSEIREQYDVHLKTESRFGGEYDTIRVVEEYFSWLNHVDPDDWETFEDAMKAWRFPVKTGEFGNVVGIRFTGEKTGDEKQMFDAIAPYVADDSFITFEGEDGATWTISFAGDSITKKTTNSIK